MDVENILFCATNVVNFNTKINRLLSCVPEHLVSNEDVPQWTRVSIQLFRGLCTEMLFILRYFKRVQSLEARMAKNEQLNTSLLAEVSRINEKINFLINQNLLQQCAGFVPIEGFPNRSSVATRTPDNRPVITHSSSLLLHIGMSADGEIIKCEKVKVSM